VRCPGIRKDGQTMVRQAMKPRYFPVRGAGHGFTLMEILVAFFLFGLIISVLFGSYTGVLHSVEATRETVSIYETARMCLERIILDLESVQVTMEPGYRPPDTDSPKDLHRVVGDMSETGNGQFSRLSFSSRAHVDLGGEDRQGVARIRYYVTQDPEQPESYVLRRYDTLHMALSEAEEQESRNDPILCERVVAFVCRYYDQEGQLHESWDSDDDNQGYATPRMVEVSLEMGNAQETETAPLRFVTRIQLPIYRDAS